MTKFETTDPAPSWDTIDEGDVKKDPSNKMRMANAIQYFSVLENQCDEAIHEQDSLIQSITRRLSGEVFRDQNDSEYAPFILEQSTRNATAAPSLPFADFQHLSQLANKVVDPQMPLATKRFMRNAVPEEIERIEALEMNISGLRERMRDVELLILNQLPATAGEVAMKLKFIAALMLDGGEIEVDFFAYAVEESAEILEATLSTGTRLI